MSASRTRGWQRHLFVDRDWHHRHVPSGDRAEFAHPDTTLFFFLVELAFLLIVIGASVALVQALRKVPVQMAKMQQGGSALPTGEGARSFIPLKVNSSGVMPIIFAQAIMFVPLYLTQTHSRAARCSSR